MNRRGSYSVFIGIVTLIVIISIMVSASNTLNQDKLGIQISAVLETKRVSQSVMLVLDKSLNDAIADSIFNNGCTQVFNNASPAGIKQTIEKYYLDVGDQFPECSIEVNAIIFGGSYVPVTTINCSKSVTGNFNVEIIKSLTYFRKATNSLSSGVCNVTVTQGTHIELVKTG